MEKRGTPFLLTVKSGLHAGVVQELPPGSYVLGSGQTADVVFSDRGLPAEQTEITLKNTLFGPQAVVKALFPGVYVNGQLVADATLTRTARLPAEVRFGDVRVGFTGGMEPPLSIPVLGGMAAALAVLVTAAIILIIGPEPSLPETTPGILVAEAPDATEPRETSLTETILGGPTAPIEGASPGAEVALQDLRTRIQDVGLAYNVITRLENNAIIAEGTVGGADRAKWEDIRYWYDQTYGADTPLLSQVKLTAKPGDKGLMIAAVSLNAPRYIISPDGQRHQVGSRLTGGWNVESIHDDHVVLARGTEKMTIEF